MAAGGGGSRAQARRGRRKQHETLPFDVLVDIAARTDPATLVRCAATCVDMRQRVKEHITLGRPLRLRQGGDRFVLPLLRGSLIYRSAGGWSRRKEELFLVDTGSPDATKPPRKSTGGGGGGVPLSSREGLVLARVGGVPGKLRVCNPATGRSVTLPSEPRFRPWHRDRINYVLLVGDQDEEANDVGRHFQVVMADLEKSDYSPRPRLLLHLQTFSSEHGVWGPHTQNPITNFPGYSPKLLNEALVVGGCVHWLCVTDTKTYALKLQVKAARLKVTELPESFPHHGEHPKLLATSSVGGDVLVLVAQPDKISAWAQSKHTALWRQQSQVVIETETILRFLDMAGETRPQSPIQLTLVWFAERSGTVLIKMTSSGFFWLDLQSKKIVRWFSDPTGLMNSTKNIPYEMSFTAWVPTFSSTF